MRVWSSNIRDLHPSSAIQNIGSLVAIPFAPWIADKFGRRMGIIVGCTCMFLATGLQAGAQNNGMFIAGRGLSKSTLLPFSEAKC
jgi:MFS family permease